MVWKEKWPWFISFKCEGSISDKVILEEDRSVRRVVFYHGCHYNNNDNNILLLPLLLLYLLLLVSQNLAAVNRRWEKMAKNGGYYNDSFSSQWPWQWCLIIYLLNKSNWKFFSSMILCLYLSIFPLSLFLLLWLIKLFYFILFLFCRLYYFISSSSILYS